MSEPSTSPILPRDGLDLDATEAHCRQGWHVPPATVLWLVALLRASEAEIARLKGLLDAAWDASGLLGADMTGQPDQACEEPSDLVFQIAELADRASTRDEAEQDAEELRVEVERLKATVARALDTIGGLALACPDLAEAVGWKEGPS